MLTGNSNNSNSQLEQAPVILVTGSAKRIGAQIIEQAHAHGYRVIVHYHTSQTQAEDLVARLNQSRADSAVAVQASLDVVNDEQALADFVQQVINFFGRLDVLVHNASRFYPSPLGHISHQQWDELFFNQCQSTTLA